jgi:glycosyltransferase involved in cell wall biosynthesis
MINIVHFGKYYFPDSGGVESVTLSFARAAVTFGYSVSVICFKKSPANSEEVIDEVKILRVPIYKTIFSQPLGIRYLLECLKAAKSADIIHLHAPNMLAALCALLIGKRKRLLVQWHSDVLNKGILGRVIRPLESALLRRAHVIVVATPVYADASKVLKPFRSKVSIIPFGVSENKCNVINLKLEPAFEDRVKEKKIILAVGRLVPYKGFGVLINAAKHLCKDSVVVIVGSGPLENDLHQAIEDSAIKDRVVLAGRRSDSELRAIFQRATLFCLPSTYRAEAFGMVLIEAMSYGLPIVASDISGSGVPWVNKHGVSGLNVPVGDSIALADACNQIIRSPELWSRLSEGARKRFAAEFTEEVSVSRMMQAYERILAE